MPPIALDQTPAAMTTCSGRDPSPSRRRTPAATPGLRHSARLRPWPRAGRPPACPARRRAPASACADRSRDRRGGRARAAASGPAPARGGGPRSGAGARPRARGATRIADSRSSASPSSRVAGDHQRPAAPDSRGRMPLASRELLDELGIGRRARQPERQQRLLAGVGLGDRREHAGRHARRVPTRLRRARARTARIPRWAARHAIARPITPPPMTATSDDGLRFVTCLLPAPALSGSGSDGRRTSYPPSQPSGRAPVPPMLARRSARLAAWTDRRERLADARLYLVCDERPRRRSCTPRCGAASTSCSCGCKTRRTTSGSSSRGRRFARVCAEHGALFILNDRPDLVAPVGRRRRPRRAGRRVARRQARALVGPELPDRPLDAQPRADRRRRRRASTTSASVRSTRRRPSPGARRSGLELVQLRRGARAHCRASRSAASTPATVAAVRGAGAHAGSPWCGRSTEAEDPEPPRATAAVGDGAPPRPAGAALGQRSRKRGQRTRASRRAARQAAPPPAPGDARRPPAPCRRGAQRRGPRDAQAAGAAASGHWSITIGASSPPCSAQSTSSLFVVGRSPGWRTSTARGRDPRSSAVLMLVCAVGMWRCATGPCSASRRCWRSTVLVLRACADQRVEPARRSLICIAVIVARRLAVLQARSAR